MELIILLVSYLLVGLIDFIDLPATQHYFMLALTCFTLIALCCYLIYTNKTKSNWLILGYSVIQWIALAAYIGMMDGNLFTPFAAFFYDNDLNFSIIFYIYEAMLLFAGLRNARIFVRDWFADGGNVFGFNHSHYEKTNDRGLEWKI